MAVAGDNSFGQQGICNTTTTANATVSKLIAPAPIITPLLDQTVCLGGNVSIPANVTAADPFAGTISYQWSLSATPVTVPVNPNGNYSTGIAQTFTNITGAIGSTYSLSNVRMGVPTTAGNPTTGASTFYRLTAGQSANACISTDDAAVYVTPNTQYTLPSNTVCAGTVTTTIIAAQVAGTGGAARTYWQRSTDGGTSWSNITANLDAAVYSVTYSTFSTPTLTLSSSPAAINGFKYRLVSTNSFGETLTSTSSVIAAVITSTTNKPQGIWSVRKVNNAYNGAAMTIRIGGGTATQTINYLPSGELDTASIKSFVGNKSAFVVTWFDQSGAGRNLAQATAALQPRIVNNGVIDRENGKPFIRFFGTASSTNYNSLNLATNNTTQAGPIFIVNEFAGSTGFILGSTSVYNYHSTPNSTLYNTSWTSAAIRNAVS